MSVDEFPLFPVSARDELQAHYNDLLALQDQTDQVPLAKALDAVGLALSLLGHAQTQQVPDRERIARAICCPSGCSYRGDSEDGEKCYCDTFDFHGSGIEKKTDAVLTALSDTSTDRRTLWVCTGCGSRESIEQIRGEHPGAIACCPERKMAPPVSSPVQTPQASVTENDHA